MSISTPPTKCVHIRLPITSYFNTE